MIKIKSTLIKALQLVFISDANDPDLPAIKLANVSDGRQGLWGKTKEAFRLREKPSLTCTMYIG